ncbi:hypothetical protein SAMN02745181_0480 [Rubritalea squalenifaciens DSM 18772]|uniref:Uncharacterized protein n=1 Tax=Rubritalea squalenifaciens DSM 18772 TaxID=1123071 RepID=A0A1M6CHN9_9BACT|nr:hypothetical protein [Rubritalea squalenifaciens]SHI60381.1 hypothetical protein SAMN02745181_0480 [Rubritalea squalenifaciens DSM 18772]
MNDEEFVSKVRENLVHREIKMYKTKFSKMDLSKVKDPDWMNLFQLYSSLDEVNQSRLMSSIKFVINEVLSELFSILDGESSSPGFEDTVTLFNSEGEKLSGELMFYHQSQMQDEE